MQSLNEKSNGLEIEVVSQPDCFLSMPRACGMYRLRRNEDNHHQLLIQVIVYAMNRTCTNQKGDHNTVFIPSLLEGAELLLQYPPS